VLGKPVAHSLSPALHNAGYAAAGLSGWSYSAIECAEAELPDLVAGLGPRWAGLSLTMPLKAAALAVADAVAPLPAMLGAANTLVRQPGGGWLAENTDAGGMTDALLAVGAAGSFCILGAGGTARAALAAASELGPPDVTICARRPSTVDELRPVAAALGLRLSHVDWPAAGSVLHSDVVISTVPAEAADHLASSVHWGQSTVLLDALYHPWPTPLAASAAAAGCRVVSGLDLLLAQAVRQFVLFTGVPAPVDAMRAALPRR
jgi:shikimate dehydrogenase